MLAAARSFSNLEVLKFMEAAKSANLNFQLPVPPPDFQLPANLPLLAPLASSLFGRDAGLPPAASAISSSAPLTASSNP
jgi:hypothetical protein